MMRSLSGSACWASWMQISGPMPAGSPGVMTIRSITVFLWNDFDVGRFADFDQPVLQFHFELAIAQCVLCLLAAELAGHVRLATLHHFCNMPAEAGAEGFAHFPNLHAVDDGLEFGWHAALIGPPHVATCHDGSGVVGVLSGDVGKSLAVGNAGMQGIDKRLGLFFGADLIGSDENVACTGLVHQTVH